jgi:hypothetical protein
MKDTTKQDGQAAVEFSIACVFILIPLFLVIPLLGKYTDIRHAAIQQARYEAWEYTAWMGPGEKTMSGLKENTSSGSKKFEDTRSQGFNYFFSDPQDENYGKTQEVKPLNKFWQDHKGEWLFTDNSINVEGLQGEAGAPDPTGGWINTIVDVLFTIINYFGKVVSFIGVNATFDAVNTNGFFNTELKIALRSPKEILPDISLSGVGKNSEKPTPIMLTAKSGVQSIYWNSASSDMVTSQSRGLVFSNVLSPLTTTFNKIVSWFNSMGSSIVRLLLGVSITLPHVPEFGYVKDDLIPYEYLEATSKDGKGAEDLPTLQKEHNLYYYEE